MEEQKKDHGGHMCPHCNSGSGQNHAGMGWCCQLGSTGKHFLLRWVLGVFILLSVFWLGVKVGELKSMLRSEFGYGYGNRYYMQNMMRGYDDGYGYPMMR